MCCLCLVLIPPFGAIGAAVSIATALIFETVSLALVARRRLGLEVFAWGRAAQLRRIAVHGTIEAAFEVEWRPLAELAPISDAWRALAARALAPNVFYEPAFALAAEPVFGRDAGAGLVWSRGARKGCSACFRRGSNATATACRGRCWSAGPIPMRRSVRR